MTRLPAFLLTAACLAGCAGPVGHPRMSQPRTAPHVTDSHEPNARTWPVSRASIRRPLRRAAPVASQGHPEGTPMSNGPAQRVTLSVTAFCETGHRTASGVWPREGMAAGNRWPFGQKIAVPGWGVVTITDRIGAHSDLDLFMASCAAADAWGRRELTVTVLHG